MRNYGQYGNVKKVEQVEFPMESLWDIESILPEVGGWIREHWDKKDMVDHGMNTFALPWDRVYKKGKGYFVKMMEECAQEFNVDELWARLEQAAKQESIFF